MRLYSWKMRGLYKRDDIIWSLREMLTVINIYFQSGIDILKLALFGRWNLISPTPNVNINKMFTKNWSIRFFFGEFVLILESAPGTADYYLPKIIINDGNAVSHYSELVLIWFGYFILNSFFKFCIKFNITYNFL